MANTLKDYIAMKRFDRFQVRLDGIKSLALKNSRLLSIKDTTKSGVEALVETTPCFELAGYRLEKQNHGAPQSPEITPNKTNNLRTSPQAWSRVIDGQEHWYYNYSGATAEAVFLGKTIPTIEQWKKMVESVPGNAEEKAQALNIPMAGYRLTEQGDFYGSGSYADLLSSTPKGDDGIYFLILGRAFTEAGTDWCYRDYGLSLRFFAN